MSLETIATSSAQWLWEQYGKDLTNKALDRVGKQWAKFRWQDAEIKYRMRVREQHSTTRLLGNAKSIAIDDIYIDVYILDKPTAFRRFDIAELQARPLEREALYLDDQEFPDS